MEIPFGITFRDVALFALFLSVRDGIPWAMNTFFPAYMRDRDGRRKTEDTARLEEIKYKRDMAERELALRKEIAERDRIIDERNLSNIEAIKENITRLTDVLGTNTMQLNAMSAAVGMIYKEQQEYFKKGEKAIRQVGDMARRPRSKKASE